MSDDKKVQIATIAEKWPIETFVKYVSKADPNEGMPRDLLEIVFAKLTSTLELNETSMLNRALGELINNGLDLNRRVDWMQLTDKKAPKVFLAAMSIDAMADTTLVDLIQKQAPTDDADTGRSILGSAISSFHYDKFVHLFNSGIRATDIKDVNLMMRMLAVNASFSPDDDELAEVYDLAKKVLSMGPDLFDVKVHNRSLSDAFSEKGHLKVAAMITSLKIKTTVANQVPVKLDTVAESESLNSTFTVRGI
jgi:hypothetical protein